MSYWRDLDLNVPQGVDIVKNNESFFKCLQNSPHLGGICVDGLCAVGKSSLIKPNTPFIMKKINTFLKLPSRNHHVGSSLGYTWSGLKIMQQEGGANVIWDRNPWNNITWHQIWSCLINPQLSWLEYSNQSSQLVDYYRKFTQTIIIVDSNESMARQRLFRRNTGSDRSRCDWENYIKIQNYFYAKMSLDYPESFCLVDLASFDGDIDRLQKSILDILDRVEPIIQELIQFTPLSSSFISIYNSRGYAQDRMLPLESEHFTKDIKHEPIHKYLHTSVRNYVGMHSTKDLQHHSQIDTRDTCEASSLCGKSKTIKRQRIDSDPESNSKK